MALHEAGLRQFAVAPLVARHGQLVGRDGEQCLVEDIHQHLVAGLAGKAHPDGLVIGGPRDAQPGSRIIVQGVAGKIERHYGGIQPAPLDGLHRLLGALHDGERAALQLIGERGVAGHPHALARQTLQRVHALLPLMGEDHVDVVRGIGDRGAQAIALGHGPGDGTDEIEAPRADGLVPLPVGVEADELEGEAGALAHLGQHVDRHAGELAVVIQGAIGVEVVHQPHLDGGRLAHPGQLGGVIALARAVIHVTYGPVPLAEDGVAGSVVDGLQAAIDEAEQGRYAGGDREAKVGRCQAGLCLAALPEVVEALAVEVVHGVGVAEQYLLAAEEDGVEGLHVGGMGHQGEGRVVEPEPLGINLPRYGGDALARGQQGALIGFGGREDQGAAEVGVAQPDPGGLGVCQGQVAEVDQIDLSPAQGEQGALLVGEELQ
ncbi:hypothetical protein D3C72_867590 [compost metagenome]